MSFTSDYYIGDKDQYLIETPYGKGLITKTRTQNDSKKPSIQEIRLLEWEKAARGVDGRSYPWGHYIDPSWCCNRLSHQNNAGTTPVGMFKIDESPYGVMGMAGNTADWCLTPYEDEPTLKADGYAPSFNVEEALNSPLPARVAKGGAWDDGPVFCQSSIRHRGMANYRRASLGFRLVYSI